jgi:hypothetical protein
LSVGGRVGGRVGAGVGGRVGDLVGSGVTLFIPCVCRWRCWFVAGNIFDWPIEAWMTTTISRTMNRIMLSDFI